MHATAELLFCLTLLLADRPRAIDRVIDYFGDPPRARGADVPDPGSRATLERRGHMTNVVHIGDHLKTRLG
jgi:hypothetical protein